MAKIIITIVIGILLIVLIAQNLAVIDITLFAFTISVSKAILLLIIFFLGLTTGWTVTNIAKMKKNRKLKIKAKTKEQEEAKKKAIEEPSEE